MFVCRPNEHEFMVCLPSPLRSLSAFSAVSLRDKISSWNFLEPRQGGEEGRGWEITLQILPNPSPTHSLAVIMYQIHRQQAGHVHQHKILQIVAFHTHFANTYRLSWWVRHLCRIAVHLFGPLVQPCLLKAVCTTEWFWTWASVRVVQFMGD